VDVISFQDMLHTASFEVDKLIGAELSAYVSERIFRALAVDVVNASVDVPIPIDTYLAKQMYRLGYYFRKFFNAVCSVGCS
jgi:hypothetical protein